MWKFDLGIHVELRLDIHRNWLGNTHKNFRALLKKHKNFWDFQREFPLVNYYSLIQERTKGIKSTAPFQSKISAGMNRGIPPNFAQAYQNAANAMGLGGTGGKNAANAMGLGGTGGKTGGKS